MTDYGILLAMVLVVAAAVACFCWMLFGDPKWARFTPSDPATPPVAIAISTPRTPPLQVIAIDTSNSATVPYQAMRADYLQRPNSRGCDVPVVVVVVEQADQGR
jgi:hypothetical protein